ncbi:MAG TPA: VWA domain-containing protein [Vicinamibacterales bacterium]|nr:VWA domain-containing protein [Vicinamibacterales bacterium]
MYAHVKKAALIVLASGAVLSAGQPPAPPPQASQPTFKVAVDYVEVDVVVTDRQGQIVRELKKEDFQVLEDGKPQTINTFTFVDIPIERADRPLYSATPFEPDVRTNARAFEGRVYVMIIDDLHARFGRSQRIKSAAKQFIERRLGANDLMAVIHTAGATSNSQEFTSNKRLLLAAVDKTQGRKLDSATVNKTNEYYRTRDTRQQGDPLNDMDDAERAQNARNTLDTIKNVAEWFSSVRGRRKTILFLSEGIDYNIYDMIPQSGSNHQGASMVLDASRDAIAAATRSNVSIYGIDPRGLTDLGDESIEVGAFPDDTSLGIGQGSLQNELRLAQDSLRTLSEETGGFAVVNRNDFSTAFDRIQQDNSSYYVLAYYPPDARPGRAHKIDVRMTRPGLTIRARKGYVTPKKTTPAAVNAKDIRTPEVRDAIESPIPVSGLTMHVFAAPFKGTAPNASVLLGVELRGRDLKLDSNAKILLSYVAYDANGKIRGGTTDTMTMSNLKPDEDAHRSDRCADAQSVRSPARSISAARGGTRYLRRQRRFGAVRPRRAGLRQDTVQHQRAGDDIAIRGADADGPARRAAESGPAGVTGGGAVVPAERSNRAVRRGVRQRRRHATQSRYHHDHHHG